MLTRKAASVEFQGSCGPFESSSSSLRIVASPMEKHAQVKTNAVQRGLCVPDGCFSQQGVYSTHARILTIEARIRAQDMHMLCRIRAQDTSTVRVNGWEDRKANPWEKHSIPAVLSLYIGKNTYTVLSRCYPCLDVSFHVT